MWEGVTGRCGRGVVAQAGVWEGCGGGGWQVQGREGRCEGMEGAPDLTVVLSVLLINYK